MPSFLMTTIPSYSGRTRSLPTVSVPGRRSSAIANVMGMRKRVEIEVVLDGHADLVHSYATYDEIRGRVDIKCEKDTPYQDLSITFEGVSNTYVEKIATSAPTTGRTTGRHTFLKVQQPISAECLPEDNVFAAGVNYSVPFNFVVPDRLLPFVCTHKIDNEDMRKHHLQLPPSLGDPNVSGDGNVLMDDLAPDMTRICYSIRARITTSNLVGRVIEIADKLERIRIIPAREEAAPLDIDDSDGEHVMRKERNVRKGFFKIAKTGRLTAVTTQPRPLQIPHSRKKTSQPISTVARIDLRFDPATPEDQPPQIDSIVSKLKVYTFFGAAAYKTIPQVNRFDNWSLLHGIYHETVPLASRNLSTVSWTRLNASEPPPSPPPSDRFRRPSVWSTSSTSSIPEPSSTYSPGSSFYTASIVVPIALPDPSTSSRPKVFVPTFHSCIVSRIYHLELNLAYKAPGTTIAANHVVLKSPIQITAEAGERPEELQAADAAIVAEIEQQIGMYEARQQDLQRELAINMESPGYEEIVTSTTTPFGGTRHMSLGMPVRNSQSSSPEYSEVSDTAPSAPPGYHVGSGFNTFSPRDRLGGPRTSSVSNHISIILA
ncbi:hypothetical protein B0A52_08719 [Exophiala mesophila]|uniref:Arrestin-like N-terminal domain-containing protein n=1 Tax=Exophiala mesophila TaxID=212818 RepID=A0A438MZ36_EXOME|nr:hypothetical protein B0A52_08719 [Exophiala mesophila]